MVVWPRPLTEPTGFTPSARAPSRVGSERVTTRCGAAGTVTASWLTSSITRIGVPSARPGIPCATPSPATAALVAGPADGSGAAGAVPQPASSSPRAARQATARAERAASAARTRPGRSALLQDTGNPPLRRNAAAFFI